VDVLSIACADLAFVAGRDGHGDGDEDDEYWDSFYMQEEGVSRGEEVFLGDPEKIKAKEEEMKRNAEKGEIVKRKAMNAKKTCVPPHGCL
jgi:hypothetical protein